jgi:two-component system cell cycle response regulator DivK
MNYEMILIVDDNPENLRLLELVLLNEKFTVQTANSAREALGVLSSSVPDALLTDIQMPDTDGLELIRQVRLNPRTRGISILAVSANAMKQNIDEAFAAGCDGYITKPIDTRTFAGSVREHLKRGRDGETRPPNASTASEENLLLHRDALAECRRQVEELLSCTNDSVRRERACCILHQCAGTAGVLGHPEVTSLARELETHSSVLNEQEFSGGLSRLSEVLQHLIDLTAANKSEITFPNLAEPLRFDS